MGKINLLVANATQAFTEADLELFHSAAREAEEFITTTFDFDYEVDVVIATPSQRLQTIPEDGIGGQTYHSRLIVIVVNKEQRAVDKAIVFEVLCHEISHSLRWEKVPEYSKTLFDDMIFEGLAVVLEEKAVGDTKRTNQQFFLTEVQNTPQTVVENIITQLKTNFDSEDYNYNTVFFTGNDELPRWAGYRLGYYLVQEYLARTGKTISKATLESYGEFKIRANTSP